MDQIKMGKLLKELRKEKNLTQEQLAEHFSVATRTVSRWETGKNMPDVDILIGLADFYGVDVREIIEGEKRIELSEKNEGDTLKKVAEYATEESKRNKKKRDVGFQIFSSVSIALSVCVFSLMRRLTGDPNVVMLTSVLVIFLLSILNVAILVLHEFLSDGRK